MLHLVLVYCFIIHSCRCSLQIHPNQYHDKSESLQINQPPLIEQVLSYYDISKLNGELSTICIDDIHNITKWKTNNVDILNEQHATIKQECVEMELTEECFNDCIWYNDPNSWILLIIENTTESLETLNRMINYYTMSADQYSWFNIGNPDMCLYYNGTYCSTPAVFGNTIVMRHGCCLPGSCSGNDAIKVLQSNPYCYETYSAIYSDSIMDICEPITRKLNSPGPIIVITIFFIFVLLVIVASLCKILCGNNNVYISSFNIQDIWKSFVSIRDPSKSQYNFLDGIRVWSMTWVILGHSFLHWFNASNYLTFIPPNSGSNLVSANYKYLISYFYTIFIQYAHYSVDSFFFLSGFLGTFSIYRQCKKYGNKTLSLFYFWIPLAYLTRILRISPMMMYSTAVQWQLADQLPYGYNVVSRDDFTNACDKSWYKIFLYYQNFDLGNDGGTECMGELWYIYNDMQMYLLLPLVLLMFCYKRFLGLSASLMLILICVIIRFYNGFYYDFVANQQYPAYPVKNGGDVKQSSVYPWIRMSPYFVGVVTMFIFIMLDEKYKDFRLSKLQYYISLLLSLFIFCCLVIWPYQDVADVPHNRWSLTSNQIYYSLNKVSWGIALALLSFSLRYYNGISIIKQFLSFSIYQPVGKLTYLMYLIHIIILNWWRSDLEMSPYYTLWNETLLFIAAWAIVAFLSLILWIFMEKPLANLCGAFTKSKCCNKSNLNQKMIKQSLDEEFQQVDYNIYETEQSLKYSIVKQDYTQVKQ